VIVVEFICSGCGAATTKRVTQRHPYRFCSPLCRNRNYGPRRPLADRFWEKVDRSESCWMWRGSIASNGYGSFRGRTGTETAHTVSWRLHHGEIPNGLFVLHKCDVRPCVNPDHLFLGTAQDNSSDMVAKGRHPSLTRSGYLPRGQAHKRARLIDADVREIRRQFKAGVPIYGLADGYGMSYQGIWAIVHRKAWRHLDAAA
jgi:hypothetical protein